MANKVIGKRFEQNVEAIFQVASNIVQYDEGFQVSGKKLAFILAVNELTNDLLLGRRVALRNTLKPYKQDILKQIEGLILINEHRKTQEQK